MHSKPFAFLTAGAIAVLIVAGCVKGSDQSTTSSSTTTTTTASTAPGAAATSAALSAAAAGGPKGDAAHGKAIFSANCAGCHGANGIGGGIGPTLKNEKSRKNMAQTIAWTKNPQPPMPKLYPATLNEQDVNDVAAFVQTL